MTNCFVPRESCCVSPSSSKPLRVCAAALPAQPPALNHSSSSEDESRRSGSTVVRRRRLRKNTTSVTTEPEEEEEVLETEQSEQEMDEEQQRAAADAAVTSVSGQSSGVLSMCFLIGLVLVISAGFRHFQGKFQLTSFLFTIKSLLTVQLSVQIQPVSEK